MKEDREIETMAPQLSGLEKAALRAVLYSDIFKYPLRGDEVFLTCNFPGASEEQVRKSLNDLKEKGLLGEQNGFFHAPGREEFVPRRVKGNELAKRRLRKARKVSGFIGKFPFVRAVMVSGSLSKNYMEADSDLDFFIVTAPGRLWVARTLLIMYKKVFLLNSHKNFCVNYFVDTAHLGIEDKNDFTATEVVYLLPTYNPEIYQKWRKENDWTNRFYPNFGPRETGECLPENRSVIRRGLERMLRGKLGDRFDAWCMKRTLKRWQQKFSHFDERKFDVTLRTRRYVSKHHPSDFQEIVMRKLKEKKDWYKQEFGVEI